MNRVVDQGRLAATLEAIEHIEERCDNCKCDVSGGAGWYLGYQTSQATARRFVFLCEGCVDVFHVFDCLN